MAAYYLHLYVECAREPDTRVPFDFKNLLERKLLMSSFREELPGVKHLSIHLSIRTSVHLSTHYFIHPITTPYTINAMPTGFLILSTL